MKILQKMVFLTPIAIWKRVCIACICMAQPGKGGVEMVYRPNLAFSRYLKNHHFRTPKNRHFFMKNRHFLMILKDPKLAIFEPANLTKIPVFGTSKIEIFEDFFIMTRWTLCLSCANIRKAMPNNMSLKDMC